MLRRPGRGLDLRELQRAARRGRPSATTSRRSCWSTRTPRSSTPTSARKVREALRDPDVGVVGCVGAIGVRSIAWWEGSVTLASFINRYEEHGGGDLPAFSWAWDDAPPYARTGEVETLDGFLLVLSPWAVRNVRFDESLGELPRLRPRLLPAGARGRAQGRDRRLPRHPPPLAARCSPTRSDWIDGAHARSPRSGTAACPGIGDRRRAPGGSARCAPRPSATSARAIGPRQGARGRGARAPRLERALAETRGSISWRITRAAAAAAARPPTMIAFGSAITDPRLRRYAGRGIRRPPSRTPRCSRSRRSARSAAATTCCSTPRPRCDDLEALVLVRPARRDRRPELLRARSARR